ncbi:hypothetical protein QTP86_019620, partial [Hemibagrus guttatus]
QRGDRGERLRGQSESTQQLDISLQLRDCNWSDEGCYLCQVTDGDRIEEITVDMGENLNIFFSATSSSDSCLFLSDTVSKPYSMAGLTTVLYTFPLILADIF